MTEKTNTRPSVEELLKRGAPPLGAADRRRVARACEAVSRSPCDESLSSDSPSPLTRDHFIRPALRLAACLAVMLGAGLFYAFTRRAEAPAPTLMAYTPAAVTETLDALAGSRDITESLATESANLVSDLADLTAVVNERSLAILF